MPALSSLPRRMLAASVVAAFGFAPAACKREQRKFDGPFYANVGAAGVRVDRDASLALPAPGTPGPYVGNAWAMGEGQRLYNQMNCVGCHSHGGGGMGPALMDGKWLYGADD